MKLVLDASIGIKWLLPEHDSPRAIAIRDNFCKQIDELIAPDTFPVEVAHALTRAERKGLLQPPEATDKFNDIAATLPRLYSYLPLLPRALELSSLMRLGVYDCLYVALAEREQCPVVTADQRMVTLFPSEVVSLASL